jgi:hypothetical protein
MEMSPVDSGDRNPITESGVRDMNEQQKSFAIYSLLIVLIFNGILLGAIFVMWGEAVDPIFLFGGGALISLLLWLIIVFTGNRAIADAIRAATPAARPARQREVERPVAVAPAPEPKPAPPAPPSEAPAIQMLSILQRKGRLIDFLQENLSQYDDAQIGAAVRNIHAGCKEALADHVKLEPIYNESEGSQVTVDSNFDANAVRLVGNVVGNPPFRGTLVHRGWRVVQIDLPKQTSDKDKVIAPAEVEVGS